jgi:2-phospho-L-lactate/phosphoenolpyruvate guanylyltransferase
VGVDAAGWTLILPLKGGPAAKSRLGGGPGLARAIALDCLESVLACPDVGQVLVVTADAGTAADAAAAGATSVTERCPGAGLVAAVVDGLAAADAGRPAAVLLGDLPALRPVDVSVGLRAAGGVLDRLPGAAMAAIADADDSGTVLLAGRRPGDLRPAFGRASFAEHRRRGAAPVDLAAAPAVPRGWDPGRLVRDVDTPADLRVALALGVGPRTAAALAQPSPAGAVDLLHVGTGLPRACPSR